MYSLVFLCDLNSSQVIHNVALANNRRDIVLAPLYFWHNTALQGHRVDSNMTTDRLVLFSSVDVQHQD